jgi:hypothetical protein
MYFVLLCFIFGDAQSHYRERPWQKQEVVILEEEDKMEFRPEGFLKKK